MRTDSAGTWLEDGYGRLTSGVGRNALDTRGESAAALVLKWSPSPRWLARVHLAGRTDAGGTAAGITEAFVQRHFLSDKSLRIRAGMMFPGTSRENVGDAWSSPYTPTLSALNSWVAEEIRPTGVDVLYVTSIGSYRLQSAATVFGGMDTAGALLAWRGWAFHDRTSLLNETLPLPPLDSLHDPRLFGRQREGTKPFGGDLDGRPGWSLRAIAATDHARVSFLRLDNEGDRGFHKGEYAWRTAVDLWSAEVELPLRLTALGEYARGKTGMGTSPVFVDADIASGYLMLSARASRARISVRYDTFSTDDRDHSSAEINSENGHAWTAACWLTLKNGLEGAVEYVRVNSSRAAVPFHTSMDSRSVLLELRYAFQTP